MFCLLIFFSFFFVSQPIFVFNCYFYFYIGVFCFSLNPVSCMFQAAALLACWHMHRLAVEFAKRFSHGMSPRKLRQTFGNKAAEVIVDCKHWNFFILASSRKVYWWFFWVCPRRLLTLFFFEINDFDVFKKRNSWNPCNPPNIDVLNFLKYFQLLTILLTFLYFLCRVQNLLSIKKFCIFVHNNHVLACSV